MSALSVNAHGICLPSPRESESQMRSGAAAHGGPQSSAGSGCRREEQQLLEVSVGLTGLHSGPPHSFVQSKFPANSAPESPRVHIRAWEQGGPHCATRLSIPFYRGGK
jgi:hypothetical protein